jgi:hypothetical protein
MEGFGGGKTGVSEEVGGDEEGDDRGKESEVNEIPVSVL